MSPKLPKDFNEHSYVPMPSETIARNIMVILGRTGNVWRELSWDEYVIERQKDGNFTMSEKIYFDHVIAYCTSADMAQKFSNHW